MTHRVTETSIERFRQHLLQEEKSKATIHKYVQELCFLSRFAKGRRLNKKLLLDYRSFLMEQYLPQTVNGKLSAINAYLHCMKLEQYCLRYLRISRKLFLSEQKELSLPEYERLLKCAKTWKNKRMYYVLLTLGASGIRVSELRFITMEALEQGYVQIHSKGKIRCIVLSHALICSLREYCLQRSIRKGMIFCTRNGKELDRSNICHDMKRLCQQAEVSPAKVFPHNFRHLFARRFYEIEHNLAHLADVLGHSSIETTRIYVSASIRCHERILDQMDLVR